MASQLGQTLRDLRKAAGYPLTMSRRAAGVSPAALSLFETGKRNPSPKVLGLIAAALDYPVEPLQQLLDGERTADRLEEAQYWFDSSDSVRLRSRAPHVGAPPSAAPGPAPTFRAQPIEALFSGVPAPPEMVVADSCSFELPVLGSAAVPDSAAPGATSRTRLLRQFARQTGDASARLDAIEGLGEEASLALRTLRGLIDDEDVDVAREARRVLRELGIDVPAESSGSRDDAR